MLPIRRKSVRSLDLQHALYNVSTSFQQTTKIIRLRILLRLLHQIAEVYSIEISLFAHVFHFHEYKMVGLSKRSSTSLHGLSPQHACHNSTFNKTCIVHTGLVNSFRSYGIQINTEDTLSYLRAVTIK